ncbi:MAG: hypothetical protein KH330_19000 [Clostridiales bacterium]|nr:hypothetical protein [Clostridiales bacterium]
MNKKVFKEPKIPEELTEVKDGAELIRTAREEEGEIFRRQFTGTFLSRIDGKHPQGPEPGPGWAEKRPRDSGGAGKAVRRLGGKRSQRAERRAPPAGPIVSFAQGELTRP